MSRVAATVGRLLNASILLVLAAGCTSGSPGVTARKIGDPRMGAITIARKACGSCHRIPGIEEADGRVGPSLVGFAHQQMIAGVLANSPHTLILYLKAPQAIVRGNAMPDEHLSDSQARDIAAYLFARN